LPRHVIGIDEPGRKALLLGNEAVARGVVESGCHVAASYPGTPASEILTTLGLVADELGFYAEWSTNEMTAVEVAIGAALCGLRSFASCKHLGVNWMMDPLMHITYFGLGKGAMVLASGDDPQGWSSANEQDTRLHGYTLELPVLEPSNPQEAKDMTIEAFKISEELHAPVILRLVTRVCHTSADVTFGPIRKIERRPVVFSSFMDAYFKAMMAKKAPIPFLHERIHRDRMPKMREISNNFPYNRLEMDGDEKLGVISTSVCNLYVDEALSVLGLEGKVAHLKMGMSNPLPDRIIAEFVDSLDEVLVVEETEPFVEHNLKALLKDLSPGLKLYGKESGHIPLSGELNTSIVAEALAKITGKPYSRYTQEVSSLIAEYEPKITARLVTLCAGCPHRATFYAAKRALARLSGGKFIGVGDIGCYGLGASPPLMAFHHILCMGGSIGLSNGIAHTGIDVPIIAYIGDSTFFHAGIPSLIDAAYNGAKITVIVMDNGVTAMTGFQPHPATGFTATGRPAKKISIEEICRACGVEFVEVVDPYDLKGTEETILKALEFPDASVVIARRLCATEQVRRWRREGITPKPFIVDPEKCTGCKLCITTFGCPALVWDEEERKTRIDVTLCIGCGVCAQICPSNAIHSPGGD